MARFRLVISGRVQGVGFRVSALRQARALGLRGWVRNLPDGRLELECEGDDDAVAQMEAWCRVGPGLARVSGLERITPTHESLANFDIR